MKQRAIAFFAVVALLSMVGAAGAAVAPYAQDFEGLTQSDPAALTNDGWLIFGNVFDSGGNYLYGYGVFGAPNDGAAFSAIVAGEGGAMQGSQQLSIFSDYNNVDHAAGNLIEANVFQEMTVEAINVGENWTFQFDAKIGNLEGATTALAFIKTLDPGAGFATTNFIIADMTSIPGTWDEYSLSIEIDASLVGQILQIGFASTASNWEGSGVFYDNIQFNLTSVGVEAASWGDVKSLYR